MVFWPGVKGSENHWIVSMISIVRSEVRKPQTSVDEKQHVSYLYQSLFTHNGYVLSGFFFVKVPKFLHALTRLCPFSGKHLCNLTKFFL